MLLYRAQGKTQELRFLHLLQAGTTSPSAQLSPDQRCVLEELGKSSTELQFKLRMMFITHHPVTR